MKLLATAFLFAATVLPATEPAAAWAPTIWQGERALVSVSHGWKAVVSLERSRLVHFGPADRELNLLFVPSSRDDSSNRGGHRLWLGPQSLWAGGWPPPAAWEYRGPAACTTDGGVLRMTLDDAGDGWPRLTRTYAWDGSRLVCGAEFTGGRRAAQFVQIFQVPAVAVVSVQAMPDENHPAGYVELPSTAGPFAARFVPPPHVSRTGDAVTLRHQGRVLKLGFRPQSLTGALGSFTLRVSRGPQSGPATGTPPDEGFFTQVYLGGAGESFIELEQLSPLFAPAAPASFSVVLEAVARD